MFVKVREPIVYASLHGLVCHTPPPVPIAHDGVWRIGPDACS